MTAQAFLENLDAESEDYFLRRPYHQVPFADDGEIESFIWSNASQEGSFGGKMRWELFSGVWELLDGFFMEHKKTKHYYTHKEAMDALVRASLQWREVK